MIRQEPYGTWIDGTPLVRTYSTANLYIQRDGVLYAEAVDPQKFNRVYHESDVKIEQEEETP